MVDVPEGFGKGENGGELGPDDLLLSVFLGCSAPELFGFWFPLADPDWSYS
jgi:hypothetical protein